VNYASDDELDVLATGQASVVYCPRTHAYFGHPPHRLRDMLARGINVAIGTDSCASSGDLNLMADLRLAHQQFPELPALEMFELITTRAAKAIDSRETGRLSHGFAADLSIFPATGPDPLRDLIDLDIPPTETWIGGAKVHDSQAEAKA
jgi:cytosine/adenosine deaminase-related metal-dependent hydrolase